MGSEHDVLRIASELMSRFGMKREKAIAIAEFIEARLTLENERCNALLISRVMMRLAEADNTKLVPVSIAFAAGIPHLWVRGKLCRTKAAAARALGVGEKRFNSAVARSAEFLELGERKPLQRDGGAAFRRANLNQHWRN